MPTSSNADSGSGEFAERTGAVPGALDLQELAARLILVAHSTTDLVGITDHRGRVVYLNPAARRQFGFAGRSLEGLTLDLLFPPESFGQYYNEVRPSLLRGEPWSGEVTMRDAAGAPVRVRHTVVGQTSSGGEVEWLATIGQVVHQVGLETRAGAVPARLAAYEPTLEEIAAGDDVVAHELAVGIGQGAISAQYQPIIEIPGGLVGGVEAFARWLHPDRGLLDAREFVDVAHRTGLIVPLGLHVVREACFQADRWARGPKKFAPRVHVNVSARELDEPGLSGIIVELLRDVGLSPARLCVEVSPAVVMQSSDALDAVRELHLAGVRIAVDGCTADAVPDLVGEVPIDAIKLDRSLVAAIGTRAGRADVRHAIDRARAIGATAIATGVEMSGQLAELRLLDCDMAQGLFFARPRRADGIEMLFGRRFIG